MLSNKREQVKPIVYTIARYFTWLHPNVITLIGMAIVFTIATLLTYQLYIAALILFILIPFDALDGAVAKITKQESKFGLFLDNVCDRISDFMLLIGFGMGGIVRWPLIFLAILFTFMISYSRSSLEVAAQKRLKLARGFMQRTERIVMLALALLTFIIQPFCYFGPFQLSEYIFLVMLLGSVGTFVFRIFEAKRLLK